MAKKVKRIGGDTNRSLSKYLEEIGQYEPLDPKDEISLAQRVKQATGSASEIEMVPYEKAFIVGFEDMRRRVPDIGKVKKLIGFEPRMSLDETIGKVIEFYEE